LNLTRNAIEAMAESGHAGTIKVGAQGNGHGEIAVCVADSGPGIAPDDAQRVFDPFYSTKGAGLGVGLSISRAIIEAHGGHLSLTPSAGGGSTFRFTLPAMKAGS
jgi:signal transduction histidine kinase